MPASTAAAASCPGSLQALIDGTPSGGTLTAPPCTYRESITIRRALTLHAAGATVDGENTRTRGVTVTGNDVTIDGLTVKRIKGDDHVGAVNLRGATGSRSRTASPGQPVVALPSWRLRGEDPRLRAHGSRQGRRPPQQHERLVFARNIHHNNMALADDWFMEAGRGKTMASNRSPSTRTRSPEPWTRDLVRQCRTNVVITGNRVHDNDREGLLRDQSARRSPATRCGTTAGASPWGWGPGSPSAIRWRRRLGKDGPRKRADQRDQPRRQLSPDDHNTVVGNVVSAAVTVSRWCATTMADPCLGTPQPQWQPVLDRRQGTDELPLRVERWAPTIAAFNATPVTRAPATSRRPSATMPSGPQVSRKRTAWTARAHAARRRPALHHQHGVIGTTGVPVKIVPSKVVVASAYQLELERTAVVGDGLADSEEPVGRRDACHGARERAGLRTKTSAGSWAPGRPAVVQAKRYRDHGGLGYTGGTWRRSTSTGACGSVRHTSTRTPGVVHLHRPAVARIEPVGRTCGSARVTSMARTGRR